MATLASFSFRKSAFFLTLFFGLTFSLSVVSARPNTFLQDFKVTWSDFHVKQLDGGRAIQLVLDQNSGKLSGQPYTVQTNIFVHGKGDKEQRINLWFDPSADFHTFAILWNHRHILFYVDEIPIRVFKNNEARGISFPESQPMGVFSTLWESDDCPIYAYYKDFDIDGCAVPGPEGANYHQLNAEEARRYRWVRMNHMIYDYCTDKSRNPLIPPERADGI
ncbi:unnamed protein product [Withania somnifera]